MNGGGEPKGRQVASPEGFRQRYIGLSSQILCLCKTVKKNLIQISDDKIFIAFVSKHFQALNFTISSFFQKESKLFSCYVSACFYFLF